MLESPPAKTRASLPVSQSAPQPSIPPMVLETRVPPPEDTQADQKQVDHRTETKSPPVERQISGDNPASPVIKPTVIPMTPSRSAQAITKSAIPKATPTTPSKSITKFASKPPVPRPSMGSSTMQPLRPQHSGMSTTSTAAAKKQISKFTTTTPAQAKTPARSVAALAGSPYTRPKTPSSGLFAPTAASLAKSRNAQMPPVTPAKKITLSPSASDRLSKPTAASLSKARLVAPSVPQPTRTNAKPASAARENTTKIVHKSKTVAASSASGMKPSTRAAQAVASTIVAADLTSIPTAETRPVEGVTDEMTHIHLDTNVQSEPEIDIDHTAAEQTGAVAAGLEEVSKAVAEPTVEDTSAISEIQGETMGNADKVLDVSQVEQSSGSDVVEASGNTDTHDPPLCVSEGEAQPLLNENGLNGSLEHPTLEEQGELKAHESDDIENMVNLLEAVSVPKVRPASIDSIPDEVHEIPDEE
ncbi:hypothetical protein AX17_002310 [Amanita inopinata Kibby_2008]|nr:hypothetical protein AX17_002310 [Amanita inopinata Kibby_2008]